MMSQDERQANILKVRASLGRWHHPDGKWTLLQEIEPKDPNDSRTFKVSQLVQSYKPVRQFTTTFADMVNHQIKKLQREGYKLTEPKFEELQTEFRNGEPITGATLMGDFLETKPVEKKVQTGWEALVEAFS